MGLTKYQQKRNFRKTKEPEGVKKSSKGNLIFCVQKHAASHLHYDFRLEMEGVLKSWAVPKGPSLNPEDKRLAMMVEDHPYSYKDFEGNIPEGNYGAGNVIVWDNGTYEAIGATSEKDSEKKLLSGLHSGSLKFVLHGKKLKGEFALVKMKDGKQENAWLLIKHNDKYASTEDVTLKNKSVISKVTLEQLEKKNDPQIKSVKKKTRLKETPEADVTVDFTPPMLAEIRPSPFDDPNWIFEIKYDGYRTVAVINKGGKVDLYSRNHLSFNQKFKPVAEALKTMDHIAVLDGEVVVEEPTGRSGFQLLQNYQRTGEGVLRYYVFDLLNLEGNDIRELPLLQRKELLKMLLSKYDLPGIMYSDHIVEKGREFYNLAIKNNLEGIIAKDANSTYRSGKRSGDWVKIKIVQQEEAIIAGITDPKGGRKYFGSLVLAQYNDGKLQYIGNCGTGFTDASLKDLYQKAKPYFIDASPFDRKINAGGKVQWIEPKLVCQVKFTERTGEGSLRHPVFLGLREDKFAEEVAAAPPQPAVSTQKKTTKKMAKKPGKIDTDKDFDLKVGKVTLHLTNQNKVYFPESGITKGDLVNYYASITDLILPYIRNRPQSMNRFPNGINGESFYQKDLDLDKVPSWLRSERIYSESNKEYIDYLVCNDKATLMYMANLGCIEINPWNSTTKNLENPDWMVIDLDPEDISFQEVIKAALVTKELMDEMELPCYCKTSGATGLHIYVPMGAKYSYDVVKNFAHIVAHSVHVRLPETTSIERMPKKRQHKIYIDFLQNRKGQTLAAPYSVRPRPGATVSTPLEWHEVNEKLSPANFTMKNILQRVDKVGDLWKPVIGKGVNIEKIIQKLSPEH